MQLWGDTDFADEIMTSTKASATSTATATSTASHPSSSSSSSTAVAPAVVHHAEMSSEFFGVPVGMADVVVEIPGLGNISYYSHDQRFQANCRVHGNGCNLTRTSRPGVGRRANGPQGRPLGLMFAWLSQCNAPRNIGAEEHARADNKRSIPRNLRIEGRDLCLLCEYGAALLRCERPVRDGEPDEPLLCP